MQDGLCVRDLACARGGQRVFAGLSFDAAAGDVVQVRGANGIGKSSLLRALVGLLRPSGGSVHWRGRRVGGGDSAFANEVAYMGHGGGMTGELTALENLRFSLHLAGCARDDAACRAVLRRLQLGERENTPLRHLSQGQQRRLSLVRVLLSQRPLWLLDEPCAGLDAEGEHGFDACLAEHAGRGGVAVVTTHRDMVEGGLGGHGARRVRTLDMDRLSDAGSDLPDHRP